MNFWRSMDIYSDHMVRRYEQSFPLERIDSTGFMLGNTGTIYYRQDTCLEGCADPDDGARRLGEHGPWQPEFLSDDDARWFAKVQSLYLRLLQSMGRTKTFGGIPGEVQPYGFGSLDSDGEVYAVVNPAQSVEEIQMPRLSREQNAIKDGRVIFRDAGFQPVLSGDKIKLGPGQMALVGFGKYARPEYDLGIQEDVVIPRSIQPVEAVFCPTERM